MDRITVVSGDRAFAAPTLTRPSSRARRLRGRVDRLRTAWRRGAVAAGAGLLAAGATVAVLSQPPAAPPQAHRSESATDEGASGPAPDVDPPLPTSPGRAALDEDLRILALDRSTIALPVSVGSVVEVIGLRPTVTDVHAEVIAGRAEVVGVTDQAILVAVDAEAAHTAAEIAAVGRVTILGRDASAG